MINESFDNESSASEAGETDTDSDYCSDD